MSHASTGERQWERMLAWMDGPPFAFVALCCTYKLLMREEALRTKAQVAKLTLVQ